MSYQCSHPECKCSFTLTVSSDDLAVTETTNVEDHSEKCIQYRETKTSTAYKGCVDATDELRAITEERAITDFQVGPKELAQRILDEINKSRQRLDILFVLEIHLIEKFEENSMIRFSAHRMDCNSLGPITKVTSSCCLD